MKLELGHIEINTSSSARTVQLAKMYAMTHPLTYVHLRTFLHGPPFDYCHAMHKLGSSNGLRYKIKIAV